MSVFVVFAERSWRLLELPCLYFEAPRGYCPGLETAVDSVFTVLVSSWFWNLVTWSWLILQTEVLCPLCWSVCWIL